MAHPMAVALLVTITRGVMRLTESSQKISHYQIEAYSAQIVAGDAPSAPCVGFRVFRFPRQSRWPLVNDFPSRSSRSLRRTFYPEPIAHLDVQIRSSVAVYTLKQSLMSR
jgi:hypothetical protein